MQLQENNLYREDICKVVQLELPWEKLKNKNILVSGASGMIGSFFIDVLMKKTEELNCRVYAIGRDEERARERFGCYWNDKHFFFIQDDINNGIHIEEAKMDYVLHAASNTHPVAYATKPIETITTNVIGTMNLLELAFEHKVERFIFASSVEIYGENRGDTDEFDENYCGYIDCNTLRAGYPESKRVGEALCQAYIKEKDMDVVVVRLARTYGPSMLMSDTKALSQFIKKGLEHEDIVLKSSGTQFYSYTYMADAVQGILVSMLKGKNGEAYNVAADSSNITLRELAELIAKKSGKKVIFEIPDATEREGYSKATHAILDGTKIKSLGWKELYNIMSGIERTLDILEKCR